MINIGVILLLIFTVIGWLWAFFLFNQIKFLNEEIETKDHALRIQDDEIDKLNKQLDICEHS